MSSSTRSRTSKTRGKRRTRPSKAGAMAMDGSPGKNGGAFDRVLTNCRVIDPASGLDGGADVAIKGGRIAAVGPGLAAQPSRDLLDLGGAIVTPGFVDVHVHVYEWVTN